MTDKPAPYVAARDTTLNEEVYLKGDDVPITKELFEAQRATGFVVTKAEFQAQEKARAEREAAKSGAAKPSTDKATDTKA